MPREPLPEASFSADQKPNLRVDPSGISFSDFSPVNGQTIFITVRVDNVGEAPATDVEVRGYDGEPQRGGKQLKDVVGWPFKRIPSIRPKESETIKLRWDPVQNAGQQRIWIQIDPQNRVREEDETDNLASRPLVVRKKADLDVSGELFWIEREGFHELKMRYSVRNVGEDTARAFKIRLKGYVSEEDTDPRVKDIDFVNSLAPGQTYNGGDIGVSTKFQTIELIADPDDMVDEETHENNTCKLQVTPPAEATQEQ